MLALFHVPCRDPLHRDSGADSSVYFSGGLLEVNLQALLLSFEEDYSSADRHSLVQNHYCTVAPGVHILTPHTAAGDDAPAFDEPSPLHIAVAVASVATADSVVEGAFLPALLDLGPLLAPYCWQCYIHLPRAWSVVLGSTDD